MVLDGGVELVLLHALPFDGSMWREQENLLPRACLAPTLYGLGETLEDWATAVLGKAQGRRLIVVGCSIGGSCALEIAAMAPDRVAALILIGTKAAHAPDPALRDAALAMIATEGLDAAWRAYWAPLFAPSTRPAILESARTIALRQRAEDVARGVRAFHSRISREQVLATFPGPITMASGSLDTMPGPQRSRLQAQAAPLGSVIILEGCGHYVPLERPRELNALIRSTIASHAAAGRDRG